MSVDADRRYTNWTRKGNQHDPPHPKTIVIKKTDIQGNNKHSTELEQILLKLKRINHCYNNKNKIEKY